MKRAIIYLLLVIQLLSCNQSTKNLIPSSSVYLGHFEDDYGIEYRISPTQFIQEPRIIYNIMEWNTKEQYIITQNAATNPSEPNLFTRIDYVALNDMEPFSGVFVILLTMQHPHPQQKPLPQQIKQIQKKVVADIRFQE